MAAPLRVLHVTWSLGIGGVERLILDLARAQRAAGAVDPAVLAMHQDGEPMRPQFETAGLTIHRGGLAGGFDIAPRRIREVAQLMRDYDLLHLHHFNFAAAQAAVAAGRPVVFTIHGRIGHGRSLRLTDRASIWLLRRYLVRSVQRVTFNSEFTRDLTTPLYRLDPTRCAVIYNGVDLSTPATSEPIDAAVAARLAGRFVVGTTCRFAQFKRVDRLVDAFARFAAGRDAVLLLVGDGVLRGQLEAQAARLGIADRTIFTGFRPNVGAYQQAMSVCVFPSEIEPFGIVALEGYRAGKPVLVFADGGGIVEVVSGLSPADVVPDVEALADRLAYYHANPAVLAGNAAGRRQYVERFDIRRTAAEFDRVYMEALACAG